MFSITNGLEGTSTKNLYLNSSILFPMTTPSPLDCPKNTFWYRTILRCFSVTNGLEEPLKVHQPSTLISTALFKFPHDNTITIGMSRTGIHLGPFWDVWVSRNKWSGPTIEGTSPMGYPKERHFVLGPQWSCHVSVVHLERNNVQSSIFVRTCESKYKDGV